MKRPFLMSLALSLALIVPSAAAAAPAKKAPQPKGPQKATVKIKVGHLRGGRAQIMSTVPVTGSVQPFVPGQRVEVSFYLDGARLETQKVKVNGGRFRARVRIEEAGKYAAAAHLRAGSGWTGDTTARKSWRVSFPSLHSGQCAPHPAPENPRSACALAAPNVPTICPSIPSASDPSLEKPPKD